MDSTSLIDQDMPSNAVSFERLLPDELLEEVFLWGLADVMSRPSCAHNRYLIAITSVSSYWRSVALAKGALWAYLKFYFEHEDHDPVMIDCMKTFLIRSKCALLDLDFTMRRPLDPDDIVCSMVIPHLSRCRSFVFDFGGSDNWRRFLPFPGEMKSLQELRIRGSLSPYDHNELVVPIVDLFDDVERAASALQTLWLCAEVSWGFGTIPATMVRHVTIGTLQEWSDVLSFLSLCRAVESIKLEYATPFDGVDPFQPHITLSHLKSLIIRTNLMEDFLSFVSAPILQEFIILGDEEHDPRQPGPMLPVLDWTRLVKPPVQLLELVSLWFDRRSLRSLFKHYSNTKVLHVCNCLDPVYLLDILVGGTPNGTSPGPPDSLRNLEVLRLWGPCRRISRVGNLVERLLEARPGLFIEVSVNLLSFPGSRTSNDAAEEAGRVALKARFGEQLQILDNYMSNWLRSERS